MRGTAVSKGIAGSQAGKVLKQTALKTVLLDLASDGNVRGIGTPSSSANSASSSRQRCQGDAERDLHIICVLVTSCGRVKRGLKYNALWPVACGDSTVAY